jgi:hypothetical protein
MSENILNLLASLNHMLFVNNNPHISVYVNINSYYY